jgi:hypothetical protein
MAAILTSTGVTFSDNTTQSTAALPLVGGTMSGPLVLNSLTSGLGNISGYRQYYYNFYGGTSGGSLNLCYNTGSYDDVLFTANLIAYHSGRSYQMWKGVWGGYGANFSQTNGGGMFSMTTNSSNSAGGPSNLSAGYQYLQLNWGAYIYGPYTTIWMQFYGYGGVAPVVGTLYN